MDNPKRFAQLIAVLARCFRQDLDEFLLEAYAMGLEGLTIEEIEAATQKAISSCRFMPPPVELREMTGAVPVDDRAVVAWEAVLGAVRKHGGYATAVFDDPAATATIRVLGGWERLTGLGGDEFHKWYRKDFERTYGVIHRRGVSAEQAQPLIGIHDENNVGQGYAAGELVQIATGLEPTRLLGDLGERKALTDGAEPTP